MQLRKDIYEGSWLYVQLWLCPVPTNVNMLTATFTKLENILVIGTDKELLILSALELVSIRKYTFQNRVVNNSALSLTKMNST